MISYSERRRKKSPQDEKYFALSCFMPKDIAVEHHQVVARPRCRLIILSPYRTPARNRAPQVPGLANRARCRSEMAEARPA